MFVSRPPYQFRKLVPCAMYRRGERARSFGEFISSCERDYGEEASHNMVSFFPLPHVSFEKTYNKRYLELKTESIDQNSLKIAKRNVGCAKLPACQKSTRNVFVKC